MKKDRYCVIRKELQENNASVPIGCLFFSGANKLKYRWDHDEFQVYYLNRWRDAYSIDFDFID
jgi:hypothetical protein